MTSTEKTVHFGRLNEIIAENIEHILDTLGVDYKTYKDRVAISCPIHDSSRPESLTLYTTGDKYIGNFVCWTNHCELQSGKGAINLVQHLLNSKNKKTYKLGDTVSWVQETLHCEVPQTSAEYKDKRTFIKYMDTLTPRESLIDKKLTRDYVRSSLILPSDYYINRGFTEKILDEYDVGFCNKRQTEMYMRVVVPVYDNGFMVGCVGRNLNPECPICGKYHYKNKLCPTNRIEERWAEKWINSKGFTSGHYFYNLWNARSAIEESRSVVLVEGQGDVWRLKESDVHNGLGMFGCSLTDEQRSILEGLPIDTIYLALDDDEAGIKGAESIYNQLKRYYNIVKIQLAKKDIGDTPIPQVKELFKGIR